MSGGNVTRVRFPPPEQLALFPVVDGRCQACGSRKVHWTAPRIIASLRAWAERNGRSPKMLDWRTAAPEHPIATQVVSMFGTWNAALTTAGLPTRDQWSLPRTWAPEEIIKAIHAFVARHGRPPKYDEWLRSAPDHPCSDHIRRTFGSWNAAIDAADCFPRGARGIRLRRAGGPRIEAITV